MRLLLLAAIIGFAVAAPSIAAEWQPVTTALVAKEKPGYGGVSGVIVDRATGHVYINLSDKGVYHSTDQGKSWTAISDKPHKGRTENPGCFQIDPTGKTKRLLMPTVYGSPIAVGTTEGNWRILDKASGHVDWCAADWSDPDLKFLLTLKHESGGVLLLSRNGGQSFTEVGKGYGPAWVFDADTAVVALMKSKDKPKGGLVRTTDGGKTFTPAGDYTPTALPRWHGNKLYWITDGLLIATADKGATWEKVATLKDGRYGPVFGKDDKHLFALVGAGVVESTDGGATWSAPIAPPIDFKGVAPLTWLEYDSKADVLYLMKMGTDLYAMSRAK